MNWDRGTRIVTDKWGQRVQKVCDEVRAEENGKEEVGHSFKV